MAFSQIFKRLRLTRDSPLGTRNPLLHQNPEGKQLHSISTVYRKLRDTVLVLEATKGPLAKATYGFAQGVTTALLVVGAGSGVTALASNFHQNLSSASELGELLPFQETEEMDKSARRRIGLTYFHMISSLLASSATAMLSFRIFRNKAFLTKIGNQPLTAVGIGVVSPFVLASIVHHLPVTKSSEGTLVPLGVKELGQLLYAGAVGLVAAPLYLLGGQSVVRAAFVSIGACVGLHGVAQLAPKDIFLSWGTPVSYAMNAVLISFLMTLFLRRDHVAFKHIYRFMMHGGLAVYSAHYLYTTQAIRHAAKMSSYDPVNASMALSMDVLNIYARLAFLLPPHFQMSRERPIIMNRNQTQPRPSNNDNGGNNNTNPNNKT